MGVEQECAAPEASAVAKRRIRVLFIADSIWGVGGAELCIQRMIPRLQDAGCECHLLTFHTNELARSFVEQFTIPLIHWQLNNIYDFNAVRIAWRLRKFIREHQIDIVHTFFETADLWAGLIAKLSGVKVLISSRRDMGIMRAPKHHIGYRLLRSIFDQVQAVSEGVRRYTVERDGVDPDRIVTIYNGVDPRVSLRAADVDDLRESLEIRAGIPVVTCVANLRHIKGIDVLVQAAAVVKQSVPHARFLVVGQLGSNGNLAFTDEVLELNRSLHQQNPMLFLGQSEHVPELLSMSDIFVLPSRSEGLSNALIEAMRAGLPCVATAVGGNPEAVEEGVTGFLVPPDDVASLADRILTLLRDPILRCRMGTLGRERFLEHFTVDNMVSQVLSAYDHLLKVKCGGGTEAGIVAQQQSLVRD